MNQGQDRTIRPKTRSTATSSSHPFNIAFHISLFSVLVRLTDVKLWSFTGALEAFMQHWLQGWQHWLQGWCCALSVHPVVHSGLAGHHIVAGEWEGGEGGSQERLRRFSYLKRRGWTPLQTQFADLLDVHCDYMIMEVLSNIVSRIFQSRRSQINHGSAGRERWFFASEAVTTAMLLETASITVLTLDVGGGSWCGQQLPGCGGAFADIPRRTI